MSGKDGAWVSLCSGSRVWLPAPVRLPRQDAAALSPAAGGGRTIGARSQPAGGPAGIRHIAEVAPALAAASSMRTWARGVLAEMERKKRGMPAVAEGEQLQAALWAALAEVRDVLGARAKSTVKGHFYAVRAFAAWIDAWPELDALDVCPESVEDTLCVYTLARRHMSSVAPILWPGKLSKGGLRAHTMAIRGAARVAFGVPESFKFNGHSAVLKRLGCEDPRPLRAFTFPSEVAQAWTEAEKGDDLMQLSWAAAAVVTSIFGLRPGYWVDLKRQYFEEREQMLVLVWGKGDKSLPERPGEEAHERAPRVSAADHHILRRVREVWWPMVAEWGSEWLFPVVQPLRVAAHEPRKARIVSWRGSRWCVWPGTKRSAQWFGDVLRATAKRFGWPRAADRKPHGLRGGRSLEARIRGVSREVRAGFCWWSLRFMGVQMVYEPPSISEMVASTREHWASLVFDVVGGVPAPRPAAAGGPPAGVVASQPPVDGAAASPGSALVSPAARSRSRGPRATSGVRALPEDSERAAAAAAAARPVPAWWLSSDEDTSSSDDGGH